MAQIKINVGAVVGLSGTITSAKNTVGNVKSSFYSTRCQVDGRVANRNNIGNRLSSVSSQLSNIENRIVSIKNIVEKGANNYHNTDVHVMGMKNALTGKISGLGIIGLGLGTTGGSELSQQASSKAQVDDKDKEESTFKKILKDDWKIEGAVLGRKATTEGSIFGFDSSGSAEGDVIGGSIKTKSIAKWNPGKGDAGIEKSVEAEGHLAKGKLKGNVGLVGGELSGTVGSVGATGKIGATLYKDGKFSPTLDAKLKAEAAAAKGSAEAKFGTDEFNGHIKGSGTLLGAEAEASGSFGKITYKDETTGQTKTAVGAKGKVGAEAYLAQGKVSGGFTIFGVKIDAGVTGKAGGVGVSAEGRVTAGSASGKIGAGLGLGAGVEISIDWSDFSLW